VGKAASFFLNLIVPFPHSLFLPRRNTLTPALRNFCVPLVVLRRVVPLSTIKPNGPAMRTFWFFWGQRLALSKTPCFFLFELTHEFSFLTLDTWANCGNPVPIFFLDYKWYPSFSPYILFFYTPLCVFLHSYNLVLPDKRTLGMMNKAPGRLSPFPPWVWSHFPTFA